MRQKRRNFCPTLKPPTKPKNRFDLEVLEPRVLLSGDSVMAVALAGAAVPAHKQIEVRHEPAPAAPTGVEAAITYPAESGSADIFAGVASQPLGSTEAAGTTSAATDSTPTSAATVTATPSTATSISGPAATTTVPADQIISATTTAGSGSPLSSIDRFIECSQRSANCGHQRG